MKYILSAYIAVNIGIAVLSSKIPDRIRTILVYASVSVLLCIGTLKYCNEAMRRVTHFSALAFPAGIAALIVLAIAGCRRKTSAGSLRYSRAFWFGWILCFAVMFIMTFVHPVKKSYYMWSVSCLFIFPLIFIGWRDKDRFKELCRNVSESVLAVSYIFILLSIMLVPFFSGGDLGLVLTEYIGMAVNPNNNGMLVIAFFGPVLYLLLCERRLKPIYYLIPMGVCVGISVISNCRTAELGILLQTAGGLAYYYLYSVRPAGEKVNWKKLVAAILIVFAIAVVSGVILKQLDKMNLEVHAADAIEADGGTLFDKLDQLSSGRLAITRTYLEQSTFWGNGSPDGPVIEGYEASKWSFNNAVDVLYISGVIPFAGCVIWMISVIIFILKCLFGRGERRPEYLFTIVTFAGYFTEFMLEVTIYPITTSLVLLAYIGFIPIACRETVNEREK
ncbi:MAG: hypothetical protein IJJ03_02385 [Mogibacterium sp.]|nr:hypothetical protein [Mogibacterium sp.]MBQ6501011.1 hypothetical protein [Mogibacterium sp.]